MLHRNLTRGRPVCDARMSPLDTLTEALGPAGCVRDESEIAPYAVDWRGVYRGVAGRRAQARRHGAGQRRPARLRGTRPGRGARRRAHLALRRGGAHGAGAGQRGAEPGAHEPLPLRGPARQCPRRRGRLHHRGRAERRDRRPAGYSHCISARRAAPWWAARSPPTPAASAPSATAMRATSCWASRSCCRTAACSTTCAASGRTIPAMR
jgi:hypothetical protein